MGYDAVHGPGVAAPSATEEEPLTCGTIALLVSVPVFLTLLCVGTPRPLIALMFVLIAIVPALICAYLIRRYLRDPYVSRSFLVKQFFLGAVPGILLVAIVEIIITVAAALLLFANEIKSVALPSQAKGGKPLTDAELLKFLTESIPVWKIIIMLVIMAYLVAGVTEEGAKWFLARRHLRLQQARPAGIDEGDVFEDSAERDEFGAAISPHQPSIGCRGVLACACTGALGLAASEHLGYVLGFSGFGTKLSLAAVGSAIFRGMLAFPVHLGTAFYIGLAMAQKSVLGDSVSVGRAFAVAVFIHGTFDFYAFLTGVLGASGAFGSPPWLPFTAPVVDIVIVVLLILLCRGRYGALLEREHVVLRRAPLPTASV